MENLELIQNGGADTGDSEGPPNQIRGTFRTGSEPDDVEEMDLPDQPGSPATPESSLSAEDLYTSRQDDSGADLVKVLDLLGDTIEYCEKAIQCINEDESVSSDNNMISVKKTLPRLFTHRSIGDGFGMVINTLITCFDERDGVPLNKSQIFTIKNTLEYIKEKPYLSADKAAELEIRLEEANLDTDPSELKHLSDLLDKIKDE